MIRGLLPSVLMLVPMLAPAFACELADAGRQATAGNIVVLYRVKQPPLAVGRHFTLQFRLCDGGESIHPARFRIDARMPAHNHGMNYRAELVTLDDGLIEARGLMFHMPGDWRVRVEFAIDDAIQQLSIDYRL